MNNLICEVALEELLRPEIGEPASEGYNWRTMRGIERNPKLKELKLFLKDEKSLVKSARRLRNNNPEAAIQTWHRCVEMCEKALETANQLKIEVDRMDEPENVIQRVFSLFTPTFFAWKFPYQELDHVDPGMTMSVNTSGDLSLGTMYTFHYKEYEDQFSKTTESATKRTLQLSMNLFIKKLNDEIAWLKAQIQRYS